MSQKNRESFSYDSLQIIGEADLWELKKRYFNEYSYKLTHLLQKDVDFFHSREGRKILKRLIYSLENPAGIEELFIVDCKNFGQLIGAGDKIYIETKNIAMKIHIEKSEKIHFLTSLDEIDQIIFMYRNLLKLKKLFVLSEDLQMLREKYSFLSFLPTHKKKMVLNEKV